MAGKQKPASLTESEERMANLPESVDRAAVERMQTVAYVLDEGIRVPGTDYRIGLDPLIGILPGAGDVLTGGLSLYLVFEASRLGVSKVTLLRMVANIAVDVVGGTIPVVGDLFDAVWKANSRNLDLVLTDLETESDRPPAAPDERTGIEIE